MRTNASDTQACDKQNWKTVMKKKKSKKRALMEVSQGLPNRGRRNCRFEQPQGDTCRGEGTLTPPPRPQPPPAPQRQQTQPHYSISKS